MLVSIVVGLVCAHLSLSSVVLLNLPVFVTVVIHLLASLCFPWHHAVTTTKIFISTICLSSEVPFSSDSLFWPQMGVFMKSGSALRGHWDPGGPSKLHTGYGNEETFSGLVTSTIPAFAALLTTSPSNLQLAHTGNSLRLGIFLHIFSHL